MAGRLFYRREPGVSPAGRVAVHLHVVPSAGWPTQNERLLRDHLLDHPEDVERYAELKRRLAHEFDDPLAYTRAKTALIQQMVDRARRDRGLPAVNVLVGLTSPFAGRLRSSVEDRPDRAVVGHLHPASRTVRPKVKGRTTCGNWYRCHNYENLRC